ncbi:hypothetical protein [Nitrosococcus wardiae]|uniref:hypothetical protein n=1 Tax=Nitrosococcus wardiae TaxID=1814290 RepID=UPI00141B46E5|nr:hypothetical protein [Nitrosococcus wardiae]
MNNYTSDISIGAQNTPVEADSTFAFLFFVIIAVILLAPVAVLLVEYIRLKFFELFGK